VPAHIRLPALPRSLLAGSPLGIRAWVGGLRLARDVTLGGTVDLVATLGDRNSSAL